MAKKPKEPPPNPAAPHYRIVTKNCFDYTPSPLQYRMPAGIGHCPSVVDDYQAWCADFCRRYEAAWSGSLATKAARGKPAWMETYLAAPCVKSALLDMARRVTEECRFRVAYEAAEQTAQWQRVCIQNVCATIGWYAERSAWHESRLRDVRKLLSTRRREKLSKDLQRCAKWFQDLDALGFAFWERDDHGKDFNPMEYLRPFELAGRLLAVGDAYIDLETFADSAVGEPGPIKERFYEECLQYVSRWVSHIVGAPMDKQVTALLNTAFHVVEPRSFTRRRQRTSKTNK